MATAKGSLGSGGSFGLSSGFGCEGFLPFPFDLLSARQGGGLFCLLCGEFRGLPFSKFPSLLLRESFGGQLFGLSLSFEGQGLLPSGLFGLPSGFGCEGFLPFPFDLLSARQGSGLFCLLCGEFRGLPFSKFPSLLLRESFGGQLFGLSLSFESQGLLPFPFDLLIARQGGGLFGLPPGLEFRHSCSILASLQVLAGRDRCRLGGFRRRIVRRVVRGGFRYRESLDPGLIYGDYRGLRHHWRRLLAPRRFCRFPG